MSPIDYKAYAYAIREQAQQHLSGLDELTNTLAERPLSFNEKNATERSLQVLVEIVIGCAKHTLKSQGKPQPSEANVAVTRAYEILQPITPTLQQLTKAVGMRNTIIHDYLNIDWDIVESVMTQKKYHDLMGFIEAAIQFLLKQ